MTQRNRAFTYNGFVKSKNAPSGTQTARSALIPKLGDADSPAVTAESAVH